MFAANNEIMNIAEVIPFTKEDVLVVRNKLKELNSGWALLLASRMPKEFDEETEIQRRDRIYNICHGSNKRPEDRIAFIETGLALIEEIQEKIISTKQKMSSIS